MDPPPIKLIMLGGPRKGETLEFQSGAAVKVGRVVRGNTVAIKDAGISTKHLVIEPVSRKWILRDLGSSNGTFLNSNAIPTDTPSDLRDGDVIKLGEYSSIEIKIGEPQECDLVENQAKGAGEELESRRRNPPRRARVLKGQHENLVNYAPLVEKVAGNPDNEAKKGRGRGRKKLPNLVEEFDRKEAKAEGKEVIKVEEEEEKVKEHNCKGKENLREEVHEKEINLLGNDQNEVKIDEQHVEKMNCEDKNLSEEIDGKDGNLGAKDGINVVEEQQKLGNGDVGQEAGVNESCSRVDVDLEKMKLGEWFDFLEIHLPKQIIEQTEKMIEEMRRKAERVHDYLMEQKKEGKVAEG
ncbi:hypothetical protein SLEP1_g49707 [Rubroshorea leprosula]|uniref:FHA domain-containing protein n=1 Tax=Rubroshorea leprosula TaxID=152421 RepID=A0AAV5LXN7_9ROSI|nr:hypothetical protein SLEP1_g49707 [Rubroshorea leprosula]